MAWHQSWNDESSQGRWQPQRGGEPRLGQLPGVLWILVINVAVFVLGYASPGLRIAIDRYGPLVFSDPSGHSLFGLELWRIITYQFIHADFEHIFFNMLMLWMFGRTVEAQVGTRKFVWLYLLSGIAGGLAEGGFDYVLNFVMPMGGGGSWLQVPMVGASAGVCGVLVAFAVRNPEVRLLLFLVVPIRARTAAIGTVIVETYMALKPLVTHNFGEGPSIAHAAHLGGMVFAFVWAMAERGQWRRQATVLQGPDSWWQRGAEGPEQPLRNHPVVNGPNTSQADAEEERRLDEVLRKVHDQGINALSDAERKFLRYMSQKKRDQG